MENHDDEVFLKEVTRLIDTINKTKTIESYQEAISFLRGAASREVNDYTRMSCRIALLILDLEKDMVSYQKKNDNTLDSIQSQINNILGKLNTLTENFEKSKKFLNKEGRE